MSGMSSAKRRFFSVDVLVIAVLVCAAAVVLSEWLASGLTRLLFNVRR